MIMNDDVKDFSVFYDKYYLRVVRYLYGRTENHHDAEDLASQVFMYCYQNWDRYDSQKASQQSWLYMIVRSRWKNYCRDKRQYSDSIDDYLGLLSEENDFTEEAAKLDAYRRLLYEAIQMLTEQQRKVVVLRYLNELSDKEIAERLSITKTNVRVIAHRALKRLESILRGKII